MRAVLMLAMTLLAPVAMAQLEQPTIAGEPSTLVLLGLGAAGLAAVHLRRRRRK